MFMDKLGYFDEGLKSKLAWLTDNQKYQLLKMLQQELWQFQVIQKSGVEFLYWNKDAILDELKEKYVDIENDVEMVWYKWKIVHINLPVVWNFKWFKFDYFVSESSVRKNEFESNPELEEKSYCMDDIWRLLCAVDEYMKELGVKIGEVKKQEGYIRYWIEGVFNFDAWDCLKKIAWLDKEYRLSDKNIAWYGSRITWNCSNEDCSFDSYIREYNRNYLFLKLS